MSLREVLIKISSEFQKERLKTVVPKKPAKIPQGNILANYIRREAPKIITEIFKDTLLDDMIVDASPGAGNWADTPWIAILNKSVCLKPNGKISAEIGFYPVYAVSKDEKLILFALGQGEMNVRLSYPGNVDHILKTRAIYLNKKLPEHNKFFKDISLSVKEMPSTMKKLGLVQFFSWFAFFTMWSLSTPALTEHVFHSPKPDVKEFAKLDDKGAVLKNSKEEVIYISSSKEQEYQAKDKVYNNAADLVGSATGVYGLSSMVFALLLTFYTMKNKINRKYIHMASLILGGLGFIYMFYATPETLMYSFILIGFSWGSILSMPYAMLSSSVNPNKMGMMMGLFNMFIVIPQIIAALGGINYLYKLIGEAHINAMLLAGLLLIIAGLCNFFITDKNAISG